MNMPPVRTNNQYNALCVFIVPLSYIKKSMVGQIYFKTANRPSNHPNELYAFSGVLDDLLVNSMDSDN
jgi:hypothetical protein